MPSKCLVHGLTVLLLVVAKVDGVNTTRSTHEELVKLFARCEEVLEMKVVRMSGQPQSTEELLQTSTMEEPPCGTSQDIPPSSEEPDGTEQVVSPAVLEQPWPLDQETIIETLATDEASDKVMGGSPQVLKSEHFKEAENRAHSPLSQLTTKGRRIPAAGFNSGTTIKALTKSQVREESIRDAESSHYDIVAQKMQSRKHSQLAKPTPSDAHDDDSEAGMSDFAKALRDASRRRQERMMQNQPRLTKVVEQSLRSSEENSESPSTKRVTSALLQKIESVTPLLNASPGPDEQKRYSDTSGWSDVDSPLPRMEEVVEEDSEFKGGKIDAQEMQPNGSVEGGGQDEELSHSLPVDASSSEASRRYVMAPCYINNVFNTHSKTRILLHVSYACI